MPDGSSKIEQLSTETPSVPGNDAALKRKRKIALITLGVAAKLALLAGTAYWAAYGGRYVSTDNAYVGAATAQVNAQISGAIADLRVDDTQTVHRGDVVAVLDQADTKLALGRAEAEYWLTLQRVRTYFAQEAVAAAQVRVREAELARAREQVERRQGLAVSGAVSGEELASMRRTADAAAAQLASAQQTLEAQRALIGATTPETHPETLAAQSAVDSAKLNLERTIIYAPVDGIVAQRKVQVGQRVQPGQSLMTVTPVAEAYVDANFKEVQLTDVRIGQPVEVTSDLYGDDVVYHGTVAGLGGGTGAAFAVIPAQNATGNWIKVVQRLPVRIQLDPKQVAERPLRVGLSMNATIDTRAID